MRPRRRMAVLGSCGALLAACGPDTYAEVEVQWLEGFAFGWERFNHRLSYLHMEVGDDDASLAVVGGTSTTGAQTVLAEGCDVRTCQEFPITDLANIDLDWATATTDRVASGHAWLELVVGAGGVRGTVEVPLSAAVDGAAVAVLRGVVWDSAVPLADPSLCYPPENGWNPTRMAIHLGEPVLRGRTAHVDVDATFAAGTTLEHERACVDRAAGGAQARLRVDVLVVAGADSETFPVASAAAWPYTGDRFDPGPEQIPPDATRLSTGFDAALIGWTSLDHAFHVDDPDGRGAYLRTLAAQAGPREAGGHATNYAPGTQLSGFDYAFEGTLTAVDIGGEVRRGRIARTLDAELDGEGRPVVHTFALQ